VHEQPRRRLDAAAGDDAPIQVRGAEAVARRASAYAQLDLVVRPALVNGAPGWASTRDGRLFSVGAALVRGGRIVALYFIADPERLEKLELASL
jgi:hypothetical protein